MFACSIRHVWREINRGHLAKPVPGRPTRFFRSDVEKYLNNLRAARDGVNPSGKSETL